MTWLPPDGEGSRVFHFALVPLLVCASSALPADPRPGLIARSQFAAEMDTQFRKIDVNKDGFLTRSEVEEHQKAVALAEAAARNRGLFTTLDTNRNGQLSRAEFAKLPVTAAPTSPATIMSFDTGRDGKVSLIEHRTATLANFDRLDTDKDGNVSPAEMKAGGIAPR